MVHSGAVYFIFLADGGATQTSRGPRLLTPLLHPLDGPVQWYVHM